MIVKPNKGKKWGIIAGLLLSIPIVIAGYKIVQNTYLTPNTIVKTFEKCFSGAGTVKGMETMINGYVPIIVWIDDDVDSLIKLRETYSKLSKKFKTEEVDGLLVTVARMENKKEIPLYTSAIEFDISSSIKWDEIKTYNEFKEKANIYDIDLD